MFKRPPKVKQLVALIAFLAIVVQTTPLVVAQQDAAAKKTKAKRTRTKKSATKPGLRPKSLADENTVADRIILRDGSELLGQVDDSVVNTLPTVVARRELVHKTLPTWSKKWDETEKTRITEALRQRRDRLAAWRQDRPSQPASEDRITAWLDQELSASSRSTPNAPLMIVRLNRDDLKSIERRSETAAQALRSAWSLGLPNPESTPLATLKDSIAGRGTILEAGDPVAIDRLLPPYSEPADHWLLRRAATEVLHDDGLRFIQFGNSILPEPVPGQPLDPSVGASLIEGTIRDVLGVARADSLPERLRIIAARGRIGVMVTAIAISPDLETASAESTLYYRNGTNWDRAIWRSQTLQVGSVPPIVVSMVASDPQVKAVMNLIDSIGAGFVSPQMKERGLIVCTTIGGAVVLSRTALVRSLTGLAFDVDSSTKSSSQTRPNPR